MSELPRRPDALRRSQGERVGREGVKYAMEDYSYERVMVLTGLDL